MKKTNKKMIISLALAVLMVCSLSVSAMADMYSVKVVVKSGQTLNAICNQYGVDYYKNKEIIMRLNGFTDTKQLDRIYAGMTIEIPASASDAAAMNQATGITVVSNGQTAAKSGPVTIVAGDASKGIAGDKVAYYIVLYTIKSGDILINLYSQWGMNFSQYQSQIMSLNGLSDLNKLVVGKMLYLPVNRGDIAGIVNYTVLEHTVTYGDTVYGICSSYGLDFNKARASLQSFNPGMDFSRIIVGQKMYIPVAGTAASAAGTTAAITSVSTAITSAGTVSAVPAVEAGTTPALPPVNNNVVLPTSVVYDGYAVVKSCDGYLCLQLENPAYEVNVVYTPQTMLGYSPRPGDYVRVVFTPTDYLLVSIQYVYNVFTGK